MPGSIKISVLGGDVFGTFFINETTIWRPVSVKPGTDQITKFVTIFVI